MCSFQGQLAAINTDKAVDFVLSCMNFDGGFGSQPGSETHSGQVCTYNVSILYFVKFSLHEIFTDFRLQVISLNEILIDFRLQVISLHEIFTDSAHFLYISILKSHELVIVF